MFGSYKVGTLVLKMPGQRYLAERAEVKNFTNLNFLSYIAVTHIHAHRKNEQIRPNA